MKFTSTELEIPRYMICIVKVDIIYYASSFLLLYLRLPNRKLIFIIIIDAMVLLNIFKKQAPRMFLKKGFLQLY